MLFAVLFAQSVFAATESIADTMAGVDQYYYVILSADAVGADTIAATEIQSGLIAHNDLNVTTVLEGEISNNVAKIFISPPCGKLIQELLKFDCDAWPYEEGQAIIIANEGDIYITGTIPNDRRRAGLVLKDYVDFPILDEHSFVIVEGLSLDVNDLKIIPGKNKNEFVCGDGICDPGEKFLCFPDCGQKTCFDICKEEGYQEAFCREVPSNPNVDICKEGEKNKGVQYCASGKSCCCQKNEKGTQENNTVKEQQEITPPKEETKKGFFAKLFSGENKAGGIITMAFVLLAVILVIGYIMVKG